MTKHTLIPSVLILAAGCSTQDSELDAYGLSDMGAQAMSEEVLPGPHGEDLAALVQGIVDAATAANVQESLLASVVALPIDTGDASASLSETCGINPDIQEIQVLESNCRDLKYQWGWEVDVENCEIDGEVYDGTLLLSFAELREIPVFLPIEMVIDRLQPILEGNRAGISSIQYELNLDSEDFALDTCGEQIGPEANRFVGMDTHRLSFVDGSLERVRNMGHDFGMGGVAPTLEMDIFSNRDGAYEMTLEDGMRSMVRYRVMGTVTTEGDVWPHQGEIEAHVENLGNVTLRFTEQSPLNGTVSVETPFSIEQVVLPMD
jgi:hypothetical protein